MNLLVPLALWGLLALALPIALHLRRRRVGRTVQIGSVRHLDSLPTAERRGRRLREPWLLLLRAAIIATVALLLARPVLVRGAGDARPFILADSLMPGSVIESLRGVAPVHLERLDDPWRRVQELDDSLPTGIWLLVAASSASDNYRGPRPVVGRSMAWYPHTPTSARTPLPASTHRPFPDLSRLERRALLAAASSVAEEFGPLTDSAGWMERLPDWWRDSLTVVAFPVAVARAVAPTKTSLPPVALTAGQLLPRQVARRVRAEDATDLHWWVWALALALFGVERFLAFRRRGDA